jgi:hypothetical protein
VGILPYHSYAYETRCMERDNVGESHKHEMCKNCSALFERSKYQLWHGSTNYWGMGLKKGEIGTSRPNETGWVTTSSGLLERAVAEMAVKHSDAFIKNNVPDPDKPDSVARLLVARLIIEATRFIHGLKKQGIRL